MSITTGISILVYTSNTRFEANNNKPVPEKCPVTTIIGAPWALLVRLNI